MTPRTKPTDDRDRIYRGGAWVNCDADAVSVGYGGRNAPKYRYKSLGFRLTQSGCRLPLKGGVTP